MVGRWVGPRVVPPTSLLWTRGGPHQAPFYQSSTPCGPCRDTKPTPDEVTGGE